VGLNSLKSLNLTNVYPNNNNNNNKVKSKPLELRSRVKMCYSTEVSEMSNFVQFEEKSQEKFVLQLLVNDLLQFCLEQNIKLIANQKVMASNFVELFRANGILVEALLAPLSPSSPS
jgi:hypothetical protein